MSFEIPAESYDQYMGRFSAPLSPQLVDFAGVRTGQRVLDVGCGPGALTAELVTRVGAEKVAAVDPSESFVEAARARQPGVDIRPASAEKLPYPDDEFDAVLAQLVVHFMADPVGGLREMARVTRPGGVVAACVWDFEGGRGPVSLMWTAAKQLDAAIEDESQLAGSRRGDLVELLEEAGLQEVFEGELAVHLDASFDEWWAPFLSGVGPGGSYVARLDPAHREELRERCRALAPTPFALEAVAWAARGLA
jgi:SAM-dependent methyltransferase